ncbi:MAG: hypothetical protein K5888_11835 [Lachnospiraceae bacterium]|nr:hypothetical protein [Lachnospiraceae bacterium]
MSTFFALLFVVAFVVFIVFFIKSIKAKKRGYDNKNYRIIWIVSLAVFLISFVITGVLNPVTDETDLSTRVENDTSNEDSNIAESQDADESAVSSNGYEAVDKFYEELTANNTATNSDDLSKQVRELADKYGLYHDSKNTGLGVRYFKIATDYDESRVISNNDIDKGTYYVYIIADFTKGSPEIHLVDNTGNAKTEDTSADNASDDIEIIYELNDGINEYINHFNMANPDEPITKEMAIPYYHHGRDHEDQIKYIVDEFEIVITGGSEVYIGYTPDTSHTNDEYKEMFKKYLRGFDLGLTDDDMNSDWDTIMNNSTHNVKFDKYSIDLSMSIGADKEFDRITYLTITKKN